MTKRACVAARQTILVGLNIRDRKVFGEFAASASSHARTRITGATILAAQTYVASR